MQQSKLILTEKAIKNHCKRLQKELKNYQQDLSLTQSQQLFAKTLGFNHFYELKKILFHTSENLHNNLNFTIYEKFVFVSLMLIIDDQKDLAFSFIDNYYEDGINEFLINILFDKYITYSINLENLNTYHSKEILILNLMHQARKKIPLACAYFLWIKQIDNELWEILFFSGRTLSTMFKIRNIGLFQLFKKYGYIEPKIII